jgi:hypothetical protein
LKPQRRPHLSGGDGRYYAKHDRGGGDARGQKCILKMTNMC